MYILSINTQHSYMIIKFVINCSVNITKALAYAQNFTSLCFHKVLGCLKQIKIGIILSNNINL